MNILDTREALQDAILLKAGAKKHKDCHPLMEAAVRGDFAPGSQDVEKGAIRRLAETFGVHRDEMPTAAFAGGVSSDDFANTLGETLRVPTVQKLLGQTEHRAFCKSIELPNFKEHEFPTLGAHFDLLEVSPELAERKNIVAIVDGAGLAAQVGHYGRDVWVSRKVIINDQSASILSAFSSAGTAAGRQEASLVYGLMESNVTLADSAPMFHIDFGNQLTGAPLSLTAIGEAMAALRRMQAVSGVEADVKPAFLVVAAEYEAIARSLVHVNGLDLRVVATTRIPASGHWYVLAHPRHAPVVALLTLESSANGLTIGRGGDRDLDFKREGVTLGLRYDIGVAALGRLGAVRRAYS